MPRAGTRHAKARELEEKFDPEMRFRPLAPPAALIVAALLIVLSCFHYYTAGFGLLRETTHRGVHLAFVLGLVFLVFPLRKAMLEQPRAGRAGCAGRRAAGTTGCCALAIAIVGPLHPVRSSTTSRFASATRCRSTS